MKLEAGMYVRFLDGEIGKIAKYEYKEEFINGYCFWLERDPNTGLGCKKDEFKASHNIIDLIEVGDYVNGYKVTATADFDFEEEKIIQCDYIVKYGGVRDFHYRFYENSIESIVTKEQFESMEYNVNE